MTGTIRDMARALLRESGPLTSEELLERLSSQRLVSSRNPKQTIRNALASDPAIQRAGRERYLYLPAFISEASVRIPMELANPEKGLLAVGVEVYALLWPEGPHGARERMPRIALEAGPAFSLDWRGGGWPLGGLRAPLRLPAPFWQWWRDQQEAGRDAVRLYCEDGEVGRYDFRGVRTMELDPAAIAAGNARVREEAASLTKQPRGVDPSDMAHRLLARGIYHGDPAPDQLARVLFAPGELFYMDHMWVTYRLDLTPALRRLFADRFEEEQVIEEEYLRGALEGKALAEIDWEGGIGEGDQVEADEDAKVDEETGADRGVLPVRPAEMGYRLKVSLLRKPQVWRVIEILDNQTLEDLHYAIQDAFHWDDDHLYAFFLSGRAWDKLTEVDRPEMDTDAEPPLSDEVELAELGLKPKQAFLYLFDFGDELRHSIEVLDSFPAPKRGKFPRIAESHGKAPPQYRSWDGE